jgi:hypothetical protein
MLEPEALTIAHFPTESAAIVAALDTCRACWEHHVDWSHRSDFLACPTCRTRHAEHQGRPSAAS